MNGLPQNVLLNFRLEPYHLTSIRNFRNFLSNGKHPRTHCHKRGCSTRMLYALLFWRSCIVNLLKRNWKNPWGRLHLEKLSVRVVIPAEILKCRKGDAFTKFCGIFCLCWMEGEVPQNMRDVNIVIPFKSEGDRGECNDYRGISLLSITKKLFGRVALKIFQVFAERNLSRVTFFSVPKDPQLIWYSPSDDYKKKRREQR